MPFLLSDRAHLVSPLPLFSYDELRMIGADPSARRWLRVRKGVYVDRAAFDALAPWRRYAVRVHALLRARPDAILCLESAAVIHGIPLFGEAKDVHVHDPGRERSWRHDDVSIHASADPREIVDVGGVRVTSLADTVSDLVRVVPPAQGLAMADAAISPVQGGALTLVDLQSWGSEQRNRRGLNKRLWVWRHADSRAESPGESVSRAVMLWSGFEPPDLQKEFFYEGCNDRSDFYFPTHRAVGESDGWGKYDRRQGLFRETERGSGGAREVMREGAHKRGIGLRGRIEYPCPARSQRGLRKNG